MPSPPSARQHLKSTRALVAGFVAVVALSLGTDQLLHVYRVYPPWGQPMNDPSLNLLALAYRCAFGVLGSYIAARLAPRQSMRHALILGLIGFALSAIGVVVAITAADLGPLWYPVALLVTALPCAWLGGLLHRPAHAH